MLIRFTLENWMSFRDEATISMVASRERQHGERLVRIPQYDLRVLPVAAIYGGNASGKTNLFKALDFIRDLIVDGTKPDSLIPVEPFRLEASGDDLPARFCIELLVDETIYEFSFSLTRHAVLKERLTEVLKSSERVLYERKGDRIEFHPSLPDRDFLRFAFKGTRDNQLFMTNAVSQKVDVFKPIYDWFKRDLVLIAPDTRFGAFELLFDKAHPLYETYNHALAGLDTGIAHLGHEQVDFDTLPLPEEIKTKIREEVDEGQTARIHIDQNNLRLLVTRENGEVKASKLAAYHKDADGHDVRFDLQDESDGTQRVIDLLPAFLGLAASDTPKVFMIDEIDRSLHTLMIRGLLENYLTTCGPDARSQLIFTTHNVMCMDQHLMRRDEMWAAERDRQGGSHLFSFGDYRDVRYDKDIRKSYLQGRMGGVPNLVISEAFEPYQEEEGSAD